MIFESVAPPDSITSDCIDFLDNSIFRGITIATLYKFYNNQYYKFSNIYCLLLFLNEKKLWQQKIFDFIEILRR